MIAGMINRDCPMCTNPIESHENRTQPPTTYTCDRCGADLWVADMFNYPRLIVAYTPRKQNKPKYGTLGGLM